MSRAALFCFVLLLFCVGLSWPLQAQTRTHRAVGVAQTGPNDICGEAIWTLTGLAAGAASHGRFLGRANGMSGATDPLSLSTADCDPVTGDPNAILVSRYDDAFGAVRGWTAPSVELENINLRDIPVPAGNGVRAPIPLAGGVPPNPLPPTIAAPSFPISVSGWLAASGDLEIVCDDVNSTASVAAKMSNLIPNGVYTLFGQWSDGVELLATPFGGLPNTIVADELGNAEICREIEFCPIDLTPNGSELQFLSVIYMGDGVTYGAVPYEAFTTRAFVGIASLPFLSSIPGGIVSFDQIGFRINATGGPDPGATSPNMCGPPPATVATLSIWGIALMSLLVAGRASALLGRRDAPN